MAAVDRQVVYDSVRQFVVHDRVNFFFFNATATTGIYTLSLHDALPIYGCLVWGLVLLTLGMVSGIVWAHTAWGRDWSSDPKVVLSLVIWGIYVVLLQGRMTAGWRGRWAATLTIAGFAVIVLSLVGVTVLGLGNHGKAF